ncbi:uncharacterized protein FOMMEDRAFT_155056 [Fomitiporia mediterranea MF3/22]|uniref:uncharacterized protein n=1 Tax=Fomitiporia mediterranea (strain MF3/22) TaxID=694068 RepID=UPI0004409968|nr:uncharacterized protein FOMMEDRAFT_155056 [Fomitiporia mediterranea MF3/22]EJD03935.1 hypothetical protein FOMMEDRAFT_155056 [Fomitiporia mediterranea MF3/22]
MAIQEDWRKRSSGPIGIAPDKDILVAYSALSGHYQIPRTGCSATHSWPGFRFARSQFGRTLNSARQSGSVA